MVHDVRCTSHDQFCNKLKFNIFKLVHTKGVQDVIILKLYVFTFFKSKSIFFCPQTFHFLALLDPECEGTVMLCIIRHCLPVDVVSYSRRLESLHVIMFLKIVILILTAIATLNLPFASTDVMLFTESVSVYKWREGVLCGSCRIETVTNNLFVNGIFTVCPLYLVFECKRTPQDICLHFISKQ